METITNSLGSVRRERLGDRDFLVGKLTMIVPGVLPGSDGPLLYGPDLVGNADSVDAWNGIPIVMRHPKTEDGKPVSARNPKVLNEVGLGWVFASNFGGKLDAEAWMEESALRRVPDGLKVLNRMLAGETVEVSTGLFTKKVKAPDGATHNGVSYHSVVTSTRPDHLAVLPDEKGACSVRDGCGLSANTSTETTVNKGELVSWLTTNCSCYKGKDETLNKMDDDTLKILKDQVTSNKELNDKLTLVTNECDGMKKKMADMDEEAEKKKKTTTNSNPATPKEPKNMTDAEWLASAPAGVQAMIANYQAAEQARKQSIVAGLVANLGTDDQKKQATEYLMKMDEPALNMLATVNAANVTAASKAPTANALPAATSHPLGAFFLPAGGPVSAPTANATREPKNPKPLEIPTVNWAEEARKTDKERVTSGAA